MYLSDNQLTRHATQLLGVASTLKWPALRQLMT